jgi:lipoprotein-anchoring transpeptidase ErfK/SrfK
MRFGKHALTLRCAQGATVGESKLSGAYVGRRLGLALLGVVLAVAPIAAGFALTSGGASSRISAKLSPVASLPRAVASSAAAPRGSATRTRPAVVLPPGSGAIVAVLRRPTLMRASPAGPRLAYVGVRTPFGSPTVMWVRRVAGSWLGVVSTLAGNNRLGWIQAASAALARVSYRIDVSLAARRLEVLERGRVLERYTVAIGMPGAPTPTGDFDVTDRLATHDPTGPYGCCILALSAVSPHAIQGWNGGNRIAIHSTPDTASIGQPASHGCLRLTLPEGRWLLEHIPLGTPVVISSA